MELMASVRQSLELTFYGTVEGKNKAKKPAEIVKDYTCREMEWSSILKEITEKLIAKVKEH